MITPGHKGAPLAMPHLMTGSLVLLVRGAANPRRNYSDFDSDIDTNYYN